METFREDYMMKKSRASTTLKTLKKVIGLLIDRIFLAKITWTGKSLPGTRKIALEEYTGLLNLVYTTTSKMHTGYTKKTFRSEMVENVMKFAHVYVYILFTF